MSKRKKITIGSIAKGKVKIIDPKKIAESNARIRKAMEPVVREFKRKQAKSILDSGKVIRRHRGKIKVTRYK